MSLASIPRKLLTSLLVLCSLAAYAQRPRWSSQIYELDDYPYQLVVADVNGDGIKDLVIAIPNVPEVAVLLGNGNGTFQSPKYSPYNGALSIAVADFTGDHIADLATSWGDFYSGSGDGYFHYTSPLPKRGTNVLAGDFNKDGNSDLVVSEAGSGSPLYQWTLLGNGHGDFTPIAEYISGDSFDGAGLSFSTDLNRDGIPDLVSDLYGNNENPTAILVEMGKGDGSFTALPLLNDTMGSGFFGIGLGDVNGDKKLDLVVSGYLFTPELTSQVHTYLGKGDGTFGPDFVSSNIACSPFAMGDLNGDGRSDLLCSVGSTATFYSSNGNGTYKKGTVYTGYDSGTAGFGIVIADLNKDGTRDAILLNRNFRDLNQVTSVTVLLNSITRHNKLPK